jgi:glycine oxidase
VAFFRQPNYLLIFSPLKGKRQIDILIVGQGLAGSAVAMRALERGLKIRVLDRPDENRSSRIAAGLFNPVTGRKMTRTWMADEIFPELFRYYGELERQIGGSFFYPLQMYRPFSSIGEQNEWMARSADRCYRPYISGLSVSSLYPGKVKDTLGGVTLSQTGYLDTNAYLNAVRRYLESHDSFSAETFDEDALEISDDGVAYQDCRARKIVFCQGVHNASNRWFKGIPVRALKGEFLTVQCGWANDVILNRGVYMVRGFGKNEWRVGSTYNRDDHSLEITDSARRAITENLEELIAMPYRITGQQWGVRPTSPDRKPIMGAHPEHKSLIFFNGFGTKGVSLAPYFSEVLIRWMENKGTIYKEADVTRFY